MSSSTCYQVAYKGLTLLLSTFEITQNNVRYLLDFLRCIYIGYFVRIGEHGHHLYIMTAMVIFIDAHTCFE